MPSDQDLVIPILNGSQNFGISVAPNAMQVMKHTVESEIWIMKAIADACYKHGCQNLVQMIQYGQLSHDTWGLTMSAYELGSIRYCFEPDRHHILVANMLHIRNDTLDALDSLRKIRWVHRDIKPDNIFLSFKICKGLDRVCAVIGDFGLATREDTQYDQHIGTWSYLPDAIRNDKGIKTTEHRMDRYAWVLTMYEVMHGGEILGIKNHPNPVTWELHEGTTRPPFVTEFLNGESLYGWYPEDAPYKLLREFDDRLYGNDDGRDASPFWNTQLVNRGGKGMDDHVDPAATMSSP